MVPPALLSLTLVASSTASLDDARAWAVRTQIGAALRADVIEFGLGAALSVRARALGGTFPGPSGGLSCFADLGVEAFLGGTSDIGLIGHRDGGVYAGLGLDAGLSAGGFFAASGARQYGLFARVGAGLALAERPSFSKERAPFDGFVVFGLSVPRHHLDSGAQGAFSLSLALPLAVGVDWGYLAFEVMF